MTINYYGQIKGCKKNTRCAEISYKDSEETIVMRMMDLMEKVTGWTYSGLDNMVLIPVDDAEDYEEFKTWYKGTKKMFTQCAKFGF